MPNIVDNEHLKMANKIKDIMATYDESEDLINIGAYKMGSNKKIDKAIELKEDIDNMLMQRVLETYQFEETISIMEEICKKD
jgi:flagellum-specific ATP synthase